MTGFNNNQKRPRGIKLFKTLALVGFMIDIATFGAIFIVLGHDAGGPLECTSTNGLCPTPSHDGTQIGTWYNMPSTCPSYDACMLFGNQSMLGILPFDGKQSGGVALNNIAAFLSVGCITGSSSANEPYLILQYALYTGYPGGVGLPPNSTNWQTVSRVDIAQNSNATYAGCATGTSFPSILTGQVFAGLNSSGIGWVFRVVGFNGNGAGDNPRFSFVNVELESVLKRISTIVVTSQTTTLFSYIMQVSVPFTANTAVSFQWIADNITSGGCGIPIAGTSTFHCWESGTGSCTFTAGITSCPTAGANNVNFAVAFTTAASVKAIAIPKTNLGAVYLPFGVVPLFVSQPITV